MYNFDNAINELNAITEETQKVIDMRKTINAEIESIENKHWKRVTDGLNAMAKFVKDAGLSINFLSYTGMKTANGKYIFSGLQSKNGEYVELKLRASDKMNIYNDDCGEFFGCLTVYNNSYKYSKIETDDKRREIIDLMYYEWETIEPVWCANIIEKVKEVFNDKLKSTAQETNKLNSTLIAKRKAGC